jgi:hypothetical protein
MKIINRKANYQNNFKAHMFKDGTVVTEEETSWTEVPNKKSIKIV